MTTAAPSSNVHIGSRGFVPATEPAPEVSAVTLMIPDALTPHVLTYMATGRCPIG